MRVAFEVGIGLDALARLCRSLKVVDGDGDGAAALLAVLHQLVEQRREALADLGLIQRPMPDGLQKF